MLSFALMNRRHFLGMATGSMMAAAVGIRAADARRATAIVADSLFLEHWLEEGHPESPARYRAVITGLEKSGLLEKAATLAPATGVEPAVLAVHTQAHVNRIRGGYGRSHDVALRAVGAGLTGVRAVCGGAATRVFCVTRPPGHHALNTGREEGFCFYNTVAVAARYAQKAYGLEKILIVDWDYHHGNGTEAAFYQDPSVLFFSTHDYRAYPGTGDPARKGAGEGRGYNINVHLDCGAKDADIIAAFERFLLPAAHRFKPDLVLVSAGFDSRRDDLLGCFDVTDDGFTRLTQIVRGLADEYCDGRLVSLLEGGYSLPGLASSATAHVAALSAPV